MTATNDDRTNGSRTDSALKALPDEVTGRAREIWLAGLGALQRLEDEGDKVFETLVERGKRYEDTRRDQIEDATEHLRDRQQALTQNVAQRLDTATRSVEKAVSDTLSGTLEQIGVPTRTEVRDLSRRVGELSEKLEALSEMLEAQPPAVEARVFHVVPSDEGWMVTVEGEPDPVSTHGTKKDAVSAARETAKAQAPSTLVLHKQDRSVQESFSYDEDAE